MGSHYISATLSVVSNPKKTTMNINSPIKSTKLQEIQAQTSDDVLTTRNILPNVNREISYPGDTIFAKQQLGTKSTDTKILGIHWDENEDTLSIEITKSKGKYTKRNILSHLTSIYDPLGFISPVHLLDKIGCRGSWN